MPVPDHVLPGLSTYNYNTLKNYVVYLNKLMTDRFEMLLFNPTDQNYQFIADAVRNRTNEFNFFNFDWSLVTKYMLEKEINNLRYTLEFINIKLQFNRFDPLPESLISHDDSVDTTRVVPTLSLLNDDSPSSLTSPRRPYTPPSGPTSHWVPSSPTSRPYTGRTSPGGYRKRKSRKSIKSRKSNKSRKSRK